MGRTESSSSSSGLPSCIAPSKRKRRKTKRRGGSSFRHGTSSWCAPKCRYPWRTIGLLRSMRSSSQPTIWSKAAVTKETSGTSNWITSSSASSCPTGRARSQPLPWSLHQATWTTLSKSMDSRISANTCCSLEPKNTPKRTTTQRKSLLEVDRKTRRPLKITRSSTLTSRMRSSRRRSIPSRNSSRHPSSHRAQLTVKCKLSILSSVRIWRVSFVDNIRYWSPKSQLKAVF